jgi:N-acetylmuramoyl-L-alanine amidase
MPSPNYSSRGGASVRLIVLHTTEGAQTIESLGSFFGQSSSQVSSHVGTDNKSATIIGEYVKRGNKAWTGGNANPVAVQCEMCTPSGASANWTRDYWLNQQKTMLNATAAWVAEEAAFYGIPIVALSASQAQGSGRGVCQHKDLGAWGGGHVDCGPGFPMDYIINTAKGVGTTAPDSRAGDMTAAVTYWNEEPYMACIGASDNRVYYRGPNDKSWAMVDANSNAKTGLSIAASGKGKLIIAYTNQAGSVCTYEKATGGQTWAWANRGGNAR